jgi:enamine deaminase RidA (YjgF/YER057c/UK114 family)
VNRTEPATTPNTLGLEAPARRPLSFRVGLSDRQGRYADAVRVPAGTVQILTSGTPGLTPTGAIPETFEDEAHQAWLNVRKALLAAGGCLRDVISVRAWLTDPTDIAAYTRVYDQFIDHEPVTSLVVVEQLRCPGMRVQIDVLASLSAGDP